MARQVVRPFIDRQLSVRRLDIALRDMGYNISLADLETAYSAAEVERRNAKAELEAKLAALEAENAALKGQTMESESVAA